MLIKSFLARILCDCLELIYAYLNEGDEVCECYSCLKMTIQAHLRVVFFSQYFSLNMPHLSSTFKQRNNREVSRD